MACETVPTFKVCPFTNYFYLFFLSDQEIIWSVKNILITFDVPFIFCAANLSYFNHIFSNAFLVYDITFIAREKWCHKVRSLCRKTFWNILPKTGTNCEMIYIQHISNVGLIVLNVVSRWLLGMGLIIKFRY